MLNNYRRRYNSKAEKYLFIEQGYLDVYKQEAENSTIRGRSTALPILRKVQPYYKTRQTKKVKGFSYLHYLNKYKGNNSIQDKDGNLKEIDIDLMKKEKDKKRLSKEIANDGMTHYAVVRPKLTKFSPLTIDKFVSSFVAKYNMDAERQATEIQGTICAKGDGYNFKRNKNSLALAKSDKAKKIDKVYYTLEYDFNEEWYHLNLLIKGTGISKKSLAKAMNRNTQEIPYLETIDDQLSVATYVNKHLNKISKGVVNGYIDGNQIVDEKMFRNERGYKEFNNHPNKEYHLKAKLLSSCVYDWREHSL